MNTFLYFAYGSNMLNERLAARCPSASPVGIAFAPNHALEFTKTGKDLSGKATLFPQQGAHQYGVLFNINRNDLSALDKAEGASFGYKRIDAFPIICSPSGNEMFATTYMAIQTESDLKPFDWYLDLVIAGAKQHNLPKKQISSLQNTPYIVDTHTNRKGRLDALAALGK